MNHPKPYQSVLTNGNGNGNGNGSHQLLPLTLSPSIATPEEDGFDISKILNIIKRRILVVMGLGIVVTTSVGFWTATREPKYVGAFQILVAPEEQDQNLQSLSSQGVEIKTQDYNTQIEVLKSAAVLESVAKQISQNYPDMSYPILFNQLTIRQLRDTKILEIVYQDSDPEKIKFVLDALSEAYIRYSLEQRRTKIKQGLEFVSAQLKPLRGRVDYLQSQLQEFRQKYNLLDPEQQASQLFGQLNNLESTYFNAQVELNETAQMYQLLQQQLGLPPNQAIAANYLSESPRYQELLNQLQQIEISLAIESARFSDKSPTIELLEEKKRNLLPLLLQEAQVALGSRFSTNVLASPSLATPNSLRSQLTEQLISTSNQYQVLEVRRAALAQAAKSLNVQIKQMPVLARHYTELQRELNIATESLNRFLEAQENLQIQAAQETLPWQLLSKPSKPLIPVSPDTKRGWLMGGVLGIIFGVGAAILLDKLDPVFHSTNELKELIKIPILGKIPFQTNLKPVKSNTSKFSLAEISELDSSSHGNKHRSSDNYPYSETNYPFSFQEAFRSLNTNIRLLGSDSIIRFLVISSASPGDGKSTVSVHLAQAAAAMGQRVLLVDGDLRRPQVHQSLGLPNNQGLSNVLATGLELEVTMQTVPESENLSVLTAGDIPPDPTRLLASKRMQQIIDELKKENLFDLVIFDTPPMSGFADGRILAGSMDGMILVTRISQTERSILQQCLEDLKMAGISVLGLVANGVQGKDNRYDYYYNYYYAQR